MRTLLLLTLFISLPLHAAVNAHIDQQTVNLGDGLQLTIEADQKARQTPDLSPLAQNFRITGSKQMSISSYSNGERRFSTRWQIMLRPLRHGSLTIPAIRVGDEASSPLNLTVLANELAAPALISQSLLLEAELDTNEIYLDSEAVMKVKLYHRSPLPDGATLSDPITSDAVIKALGEPRQYQAPLRGQSYHVLEQNYGIYPKYSGLIQFEPISYNDGQPGSLDQVLQKEPLELAVLPKASRSAPGFWLPAKSATLTDNLQRRSSATLGDSLQRVITLEAHGILASELPSLSPLRNELADIQLDNVILEERLTAQGIVSLRTEELTVTPTERGEITLSEIVIPWWDVIGDKPQQANLPATLINVSAARPEPKSTTTAITPVEGLAPAESAPAAPPATSRGLPALVWVLTGLAIISSLGWLYTYNRMRKRSRPATGTAAPAAKPVTDKDGYEEVDLLEEAERNSYEELAIACGQNDCESSRVLLMAWAQYFWPGLELYTSADVAIAAGHQTFELVVQDMEHHFTQGEAHLWQGDLLLEAVSRLRERRQGEVHTPYGEALHEV